MRRSITIGRWQLELYQRAIYLTRGPDPDCWDCAGHGGFEFVTDQGAETEVCDCWDPDSGWRIPLAPRRTQAVPF